MPFYSINYKMIAEPLIKNTLDPHFTPPPPHTNKQNISTFNDIRNERSIHIDSIDQVKSSDKEEKLL